MLRSSLADLTRGDEQQCVHVSQRRLERFWPVVVGFANRDPEVGGVGAYSRERNNVGNGDLLLE
jgi:hypothetical protein